MLQKNSCHPAQITGYTSEGMGVAHMEGRAVFVARAIAGERGLVQLLKVTSARAYGKWAQLETPSPHRQTPACPYFGRCGGCDFWHMDYEEELRLKADRVRDALARIGGWDPGPVSILAAPTCEHYRNKAQYPVAAVDGRPEAGFYRARTHQLIAVERCRIQSAQADRIRAAVLQWMREQQVSAYDEATRTGCVRHIFVRTGMKTGQSLLCLVVNGRSVPRSDLLTDYVLRAEPSVKTVVLNFNARPGNAILGETFKPIYGDGTIEDVLCGLTFRLSPRSFYQVNRDQAERLYEAAIAQAQLTGREVVLDLYCGTGTITLAMAGAAGRVIGVEIVEQAIADARENARRNHIENAEFFCADAGQAAQRLAEEGVRPDVITVDPPRKGLHPAVIDAIARMAPRRVVYISCDPATLARDVALLAQRGFLPSQAQAADLFPRCAHVESIVLLTRTAPESKACFGHDCEDSVQPPPRGAGDFSL